MTSATSFDLDRFRTAQEPVFETALAELRAGRKRSHWMWFIFPQLRGLGRSPTAQHFGIATIDEAGAYLADPVLGGRLRVATETVLAVQDRSAHQIFGSPDDLKFRSDDIVRRGRWRGRRAIPNCPPTIFRRRAG